MKSLVRPGLGLTGIGLILLLGGTGCATTSDLQQLDQGLTQKLAALNTTIRTQVDDLRKELSGVRTGQEKRQEDLGRNLEAVKSTLEAEVVGLRAQVDTLKVDTKAALEEVKTRETLTHQIMKEVKSDTATTRKAFTEYVAKSSQDLERIEAFAGDLTKQLQSVQAEMSTLKQLPPLVTNLGAEMQALTQTLLGSYKLEEAALKDRLKTLEQVIKQLEPATPQQAGGIPSR